MGLDRDTLLPEPDEEYRLAHRVLGKSNDLDRRILTVLIGRPRRFSDLQPLLGTKAKNNLTAALARLRRDGIIDQRVDARQNPPSYSYELTELGVLVVIRMTQMLPAHESARILERGIQADA